MTRKVLESIDIQFKTKDQINSILNLISEMYKDPYRVMYEFIQNSVDSAEELRRKNGKKYPYPIKIYLLINKKNKEFKIVDNCKGMNLNVMRGLANKIFDSSKKHLPWTIGKFGYGIHSFRAFFKKITFTSKIKGEKPKEISFEKNKVENNQLFELGDRDVDFNFSSGTSVKLNKLDGTRYKFSNINVNKIKEAIELHCENILREKDLNIFVGVGTKKTLKCQPFNYDTIDGTYYKKDLSIDGKKVEIFLKITKKPLPERKVRFTCKNFRINEVANCYSYRKSSNNIEIWDHPNLIGFIEVHDLVSPELERSDFPKTKERDQLYHELNNVEIELKDLLDKALEKTKFESLNSLSSVLEDVFSQISKEDDLLFREALRKARKGETGDFEVSDEGGGDQFGEGGPGSGKSINKGGDGSDTGSGYGPNRSGIGGNVGEGEGGIGAEKVEDGIEVKKRKTTGFSVKFHQLGEDFDMATEINNEIVVNVDHPNFKERARSTKTGRVNMRDGRLAAYCAQLITTYYIIARDSKRKKLHEGIITDGVYKDFTDVVCKADDLLYERREELNKLINESLKNENKSK